jgi:hypothetical protein
MDDFLQPNEILALPPALGNRLLELNRLVTLYPASIPVATCAKFLGISVTGLHYAILNGNIPGGFCWKQPGKKNHGYRIASLPFYRWQTANSEATWSGKKAV